MLGSGPGPTRVSPNIGMETGLMNGGVSGVLCPGLSCCCSMEPFLSFAGSLWVCTVAGPFP